MSRIRLPTSMSTPLIERPIFIVGLSRSGTTLLRSLLSAHPEIAITPETHFMERAEKGGALDREAPADFEAFWDRYTDSTRFKDLDLDAVRCRELIKDPSFRSVFEAILAAYRERAGKRRIGEKTPQHVRFLPHLFDWFPDARVLIVRRDPRAVIASLLKTPWVRRQIGPVSLRHGVFTGKRLTEVVRYTDEWVNTYQTIVPSWQNDPRVLLLSYEAVVRDVEGEMRRVCAFLGESYDPAMLNDRTAESVPPPAATAGLRDEEWKQWRHEHHARTREAVSSGSLEKWTKELTPAEVALIESRCGTGMRAAGYALSGSVAHRSAGRALWHGVVTVQRAEVTVRSRANRLFRPLYSLLRTLQGVGS